MAYVIMESPQSQLDLDFDLGLGLGLRGPDLGLWLDNKRTSIYPVNLIFLDVGQITYAVNALRVHSADIRPPAKACTAFECTGSFIS